MSSQKTDIDIRRELARATRATTRGDTPVVPMSATPNSHPSMARSASGLLSNKGVPMCCPVVKAQEQVRVRTAPNAVLPSLPAGCFEATTGFSVFLRGSWTSTDFNAMLAPCGPCVTTPSSCAREGGGAIAMTSPPDPHGTTDSRTSASPPGGRSPSVRAYF